MKPVKNFELSQKLDSELAVLIQHQKQSFYGTRQDFLSQVHVLMQQLAVLLAE